MSLASWFSLNMLHTNDLLQTSWVEQILWPSLRRRLDYWHFNKEVFRSAVTAPLPLQGAVRTDPGAKWQIYHLLQTRSTEMSTLTYHRRDQSCPRQEKLSLLRAQAVRSERRPVRHLRELEQNILLCLILMVEICKLLKQRLSRTQNAKCRVFICFPSTSRINLQSGKYFPQLSRPSGVWPSWLITPAINRHFTVTVMPQLTNGGWASMSMSEEVFLSHKSLSNGQH